jgi:hypothetical protein
MTRGSDGSTRARTFLKAIARYGEGKLSAECIVREISPTSAILQVTEGTALPSHFELDVPQRGAHYKCALKEWHGDKAMVSLEAVSAEVVATPGERLQALEAENAALRREVARLREAFEDKGSSI